MAWFKRDKKSIEQSTPPEERKVRTEGLWVKCESCRTIVFRKDLEANLLVCPKCQFHFKMNAKQRLEMLLDGRWTEHDARMTSTDPLKFVDTKPYATRLKEARKKLGMNDAIITAEGQLARPSGGVLRDGVQFHWRVDGRGRRREGHARHRTGARHAPAVDRRLVFRRRAHDGRHHQPDATGESFRRAGEAGRRQGAVHLRADRSHNRWRHGQFRDARATSTSASPAR